jgi:hypothetical protein
MRIKQSKQKKTKQDQKQNKKKMWYKKKEKGRNTDTHLGLKKKARKKIGKKERNG